VLLIGRSDAKSSLGGERALRPRDICDADDESSASKVPVLHSIDPSHDPGIFCANSDASSTKAEPVGGCAIKYKKPTACNT
jgi:hypothetical protein